MEQINEASVQKEGGARLKKGGKGLYIALGVIVLALAGIANMVRKEALDLKFALSWLAVGVIVLILDIFPGIMNYLVSLLGIELPVNMMFFFGFCFTLLLVFTLTVKVSKQAEQLKRLTQTIALLEENIRKGAEVKSKDE